MKCYQLEVFFASEIEDKNKEEFVQVIMLSLMRGPTIAIVNCNAFINTHAMRSCISGTF